MFSFKSSHRRWSVKIRLLKISQMSQENTFAGLQAPTQVFPCKICEIFMNICFEEYLRTTASAVFFSWHLRWSLFLKNLQVFRSATLLKRDFNTDFQNF